MNVLIQNDTPCGPFFVRKGLANVFAAMGDTCIWWDPARKPTLDAFYDYKPDLFIGQTYNVDRAMVRAISNRPEMKVALYSSAWGPMLNDLDTKKYPIVMVQDKEKKIIEELKKATGKPDLVWIHVSERFLNPTMGGWTEIGVQPLGLLNAADTFSYLGGQHRPELACDIGFVGGYWGYKAKNLDRFIMPMCHPDSGLNVKIFGNQPWPGARYLGFLDERYSRDLFASATVCPNVSEPHSTDLGFDVIERPFKVLAAGGFCVSDYVESMQEDIFFNGEVPCETAPHMFIDVCRHFVAHPEERNVFMERGRETVLRRHTYFNRVIKLCSALGLHEDATKAAHLHGEMLTREGLGAE